MKNQYTTALVRNLVTLKFSCNPIAVQHEREKDTQLIVKAKWIFLPRIRRTHEGGLKVPFNWISASFIGLSTNRYRLQLSALALKLTKQYSYLLTLMPWRVRPVVYSPFAFSVRATTSTGDLGRSQLVAEFEKNASIDQWYRTRTQDVAFCKAPGDG